MMRSGGFRWTIAAVLAAAAVVSVSAISRVEARADHADPAVEAAVLAETIEFFEAKFENDPHNYVIAGRLVDDHMLSFQLDSDLAHLSRAEEVARAVLSVAPDSALSFARLSTTLLAQHKFAGALEAAQRAFAADTAGEAALATLFDAAVAAGSYGTAERALKALEPGTLTRQLREARWLAALGQADYAVSIMEGGCRRLERGTARRQVVAWCQSLLAGLEHGRSGDAAAEYWLRRALRTQPGYVGALEGLANLAYARGNWEKAKGLFAQILSEAHPDLYLRKAEVSLALGDTEAATASERAFVRLATAPGAEALNAHPLAIYYAARPESRDRALEIILRDLERRPSIETYGVLSWVRLQRGELAEALEASNQSRRWGEPSPTNDYMRARVLAALGRTDEARQLFDNVLADPTQLDHYVLQEMRRRGQL